MHRLGWLLFFLISFISCKKEQKMVPIQTVEPTDSLVVPHKTTTIDTSLLTSFSKEIKNVYRKNKFEPLWKNERKRNQVIEILASADDFGLKSKDYIVSKNKNFGQKKAIHDSKEAHQYDIELTQKLWSFLHHLSHGKYVNSSKKYEYAIQSTSIDIQTLLLEIHKNNQVLKTIQKAEPSHAVYQSLKEALKIIRSFPDQEFETIISEKKIEVNQNHPSMKTIKQKLVYWRDLEKNDDSTQLYTPEVEIAIKKFQKRHGLKADGVIGKGTLAALNKSKKDRENQIVFNMERWRWFPRDLGKHHLLVNIPDFHLYVMHKQDTVQKHKIIVGNKLRKTPLLTSKLSSLVFNPTWTIPPTIKKEDVVPATRRNLDYLNQKNITVYDTKGQIITPQKWEASKALSYRYVQSPGSHNALGLVKFMFNNPFSVYLHDTNNRNMFGQENRALSSGCVRVENPMELAHYILNLQKEISLEKIHENLSGEKTFQEKITTDIQVHLWYWTVWSEKGTLIFRDDIYQLDQVL